MQPNIMVQVKFGCLTVKSQSNQMAPEQQSPAPYQHQHSPPWSITGRYNNCLCGHNPATSATPGPKGLDMSNTFKLL